MSAEASAVLSFSVSVLPVPAVTVTLQNTVIAPSRRLAAMVAVPAFLAASVPFVTLTMSRSDVPHTTFSPSEVVAFKMAVFPACKVRLDESNVMVLSAFGCAGAFTRILHVAFFPLPSFAAAVITAVPEDTALSFPFAVTVTMLLSLLVHVTVRRFAFVGFTFAFNV